MRFIVAGLALALGLVVVAVTLGAELESEQVAVQPYHCLQPWADSLAAGDSVYVVPTLPAQGFTFATSQACSLRVYSGVSCVVDSIFMHFEKDECFEFPQLAADSLLVVSKSAAAAFIRIWFWRR